VSETEPERSGLWLAPDPGTSTPSRIEVADVTDLKLAAGLVTLSACETGLGRIESGEGVIGLSRAFMGAGAHSVMVSLWPVNDRSTADLMSRFYRRALDGKTSRDDALASAKRALLASADMRAPFHWAPFVLIGASGAR
jgi:CHAT domain-containing protein